MSGPFVLKDLGLVVGLEWVLADNVKEAKRALKGKGAVYYARSMVGVECVQAIVPAKSIQPKLAKKVRAGALMVASGHPNAVVYHPIDEDLVWVCAIRDGIPLPGYDRVLSAHDAQSVIGEAMGYVGNGDVIGALSGSVSGLPAVLRAVPAKVAKQCLLRSNRLPVLPIVSAVVLVGAAGAGVVVFDKIMSDMEQRKSVAEALAEQLRLTAEKKAADARARADFAQKVEAMRATLYDAPNPAEQYAIWLGVVHSLPLSHHGWVVSSVECDRARCKVSWSRKDARAPFGEVNSLPGNVEAVAAEDAKTVLMLPDLPVVHWGSPDTQAIQAIIDYPARIAWVKKIKMTLNPPKQAIEVPSGLPDVPAAQIGKEGTWSISSDDVALLQTVMRELALPSVAATGVKFTSFSLGVPKSVEINGVYRVPN